MIELDFLKLSQNKIRVLIFILAFILYGNSINNEYAVDDNLVVDGVEKVEKGFSGIKDIFRTHLTKTKKQNYGYRPIVLTTFAIEKQIFKNLPPSQSVKEKSRMDILTQANISHFINVLLYALTGILLFNFLLLLFKDYNVLLSLTITLFFLVHPIHTEPVANIKSRDELIVFLMVILSLTHFVKYAYYSKYKHLILAILFTGIAVFSKKTGLVLFGLIPVVLYFANAGWKKIVVSLGVIILLVLALIRVKQGLLGIPQNREYGYFENPLFFENGISQRITLGLYSAWFYLKQLIYPKTMAFYYGYSHIPLANWSYYQVWLALIVYVPIGIYGFWSFLKREVLGLGIVIWFGILLAYVNVISPVVGIVADRFTYVFSLGFSISIVFLILTLFKVDIKGDKFKVSYSLIGVLLVIFIAYSARTISRNNDWENYLTLYYHDVEVVDESAKAHAMIASTLYPLALNYPNGNQFNEYVEEIIYHYTRAVEIDSSYLTSLNNLASAYSSFYRDYDKAIYYGTKAVEIDSNHAVAHLNVAVGYNNLSQPDSAYKYFLNSVVTDEFTENDYNEFTNFLHKEGMLDQGLADLLDWYEVNGGSKAVCVNIANIYSTNLDNTDESITYFVKAFEYDPTDKVLCGHIAKLYKSIEAREEWKYYMELEKTL